MLWTCSACCFCARQCHYVWSCSSGGCKCVLGGKPADGEAASDHEDALWSLSHALAYLTIHVSGWCRPLDGSLWWPCRAGPHVWPNTKSSNGLRGCAYSALTCWFSPRRNRKLLIGATLWNWEHKWEILNCLFCGFPENPDLVLLFKADTSRAPHPDALKLARNGWTRKEEGRIQRRILQGRERQTLKGHVESGEETMYVSITTCQLPSKKREIAQTTHHRWRFDSSVCCLSPPTFTLSNHTNFSLMRFKFKPILTG